MDINSLPPIHIKNLMYQFGIKPSKGLGQNFLIDESILKEIVVASGVNNRDTVLEVGPGMGSLTRYLAVAAARVVAVELDQKLFPVLETVLNPFENIHLIQGDFLALKLADLVAREDYLVVANIPYYITSAILRHLLEGSHPPRRIILTVQKEIAERICAQSKLSLLAVSVQVYGKPSILMQIPAKSFFPVPNVDSALVEIELFQTPMVKPEQLELFFLIAKAGFSQKRKTLRNSLSAGLHLPALEIEKMLNWVGIDPQRRAETLSLAEWGKLTARYTEIFPG